MEHILETTTDTDQVRAVIGISDRDLSDEEFDAPRVELELSMELDKESVDYGTIITAGEGATPTAEETKRYNYLKLYSIYFCSILVLPRLRLAATQKMSDGDNSMERFLKPEFEKLESLYAGKASTYLTNMKDAVSGGTTSQVTLSTLSGAAPAYDPVIGS